MFTNESLFTIQRLLFGDSTVYTVPHNFKVDRKNPTAIYIKFTNESFFTIQRLLFGDYTVYTVAHNFKVDRKNPTAIYISKASE